MSRWPACAATVAAVQLRARIAQGEVELEMLRSRQVDGIVLASAHGSAPPSAAAADQEGRPS